MAVLQVWEDWRGGYRRPDGPVLIPPGYGYLPAGDGPLTRAVGNGAGGRPLYAVMKKVSKRYPSRQIGLWAPQAVIDAEREGLAAKRTPVHAEKLAERRERRQERDIRNFAAAILARFPGCPEPEAREIAVRACEIGSGRVGRSSTAEDPVLAAVVAHVRHQHTDYDEILEDGRASAVDADDMRRVHQQARAAVKGRVSDVLHQWEWSGAASALPA